MQTRDIIIQELKQLFEEDELELLEFTDDVILLDTELDSLGFAVLVTRLEDELGYDPFSLMEEPVYPETLGDFITVYEKFAPSLRDD